MAHRVILDRPGYLKALRQRLIDTAKIDPVYDLAKEAVELGKFTEGELTEAIGRKIDDVTRMKFLNHVREVLRGR